MLFCIDHHVYIEAMEDSVHVSDRPQQSTLGGIMAVNWSKIKQVIQPSRRMFYYVVHSAGVGQFEPDKKNNNIFKIYI